MSAETQNNTGFHALNFAERKTKARSSLPLRDPNDSSEFTSCAQELSRVLSDVRGVEVTPKVKSWQGRSSIYIDFVSLDPYYTLTVDGYVAKVPKEAIDVYGQLRGACAIDQKERLKPKKQNGNSSNKHC